MNPRTWPTRITNYKDFVRWSQRASAHEKGKAWERLVSAHLGDCWRPRHDLGIDLVRGSIAVQCKNVPGATLRLEDLATFFAWVGNDPRYTGGLICTTASRIAPSALKLMKGSAKPYDILTSRDWSEILPPAFWSAHSAKLIPEGGKARSRISRYAVPSLSL